MRVLDFMEPEEAVGNLWHDMASGIAAEQRYPEAAVALSALRPSLAVLFRALGGAAGVELGEAAATVVRHRQPLKRKLGRNAIANGSRGLTANACPCRH